MQINDQFFCDSCFKLLSSEFEQCNECNFVKENYNPEIGILPIGEILLGRYLIGKKLGRGGFGVTYLGFDLKLEKKVAIKEYFPDGLATRHLNQTKLSIYTGEKTELFQKGAHSFLEEAKIVSKFNGNPNIVSVYEFFYENETAYFVMEYLEGVDLKRYMMESGKQISEEELVELIAPIMQALIIVHNIGVLHRDISPDNIFLTSDKNVKLIDFGAARQVLGEESKSLSVVLKQGFAPIEQYQTRGKQGQWTDIYGLGATMYYCLTGRTPDSALDRLEEDTLKMPSELGFPVSPSFERALKKALSVRAIDRYQTIIEFKNDLNLFPQEQNNIVDSYAKTSPLQPKKKLRIAEFFHNNKKLIGIAGSICAVIIIFVIVINSFPKMNPFVPNTNNVQNANHSISSKTTSNQTTQASTSSMQINSSKESINSKTSSQEPNNSKETTVSSSTTSNDKSQADNSNIPVTNISISKSSAKLNIGDQLTLSASITPSNASNKQLIWSSDNNSVASINNGQVTAKGAGAAIITVTSKDGNKTATCTITVEAAISKAVNEPHTIITNLYTVKGTYTGEWKDGKPNGKGTFTVTEEVPSKWDVGDQLIGTWSNGYLNGYAEYHGVSGWSYKGGFRNGLKHGKGAWYYNNVFDEEVYYNDGIEA
ncbi:protein kinase [Paludicola sp. MB14-C6]|uniref:protein kinase domain-containing protein n=1 Tax=Paludihabitans sp. MB14-C6 TaxID=3070656 RepID=UPI0027DD230A|nr:protein kinase [Paludicola sp. MB14-C6]WMJ22752.1 protein kinase [Paludicola sp. MB14-C6]